NSRKVLLRLGDIELLLVTFYTKLDILDSSFDDETSGKHTQSYRQIYNFIVVDLE
ncbi:hypothetical protein Tco_0696587, partial [Tanacetum coccineum]